METIRPFQRVTKTTRLNVSAVSSGVVVSGQRGTGSLRIYNDGPDVAFVNFGKPTDSAGVPLAATIPVAGGAAGSMPVMPGSVEVFQVRSDFTTVTAICAGAETAVLYLTLGYGA